MDAIYNDKFSLLSFEAQSGVKDFIDFLFNKDNSVNSDGLTNEQVLELRSRLADLRAGNGKVHELIEV